MNLVPFLVRFQPLGRPASDATVVVEDVDSGTFLSVLARVGRRAAIEKDRADPARIEPICLSHPILDLELLVAPIGFDGSRVGPRDRVTLAAMIAGSKSADEVRLVVEVATDLRLSVMLPSRTGGSVRVSRADAS